MGKYTKHKQKIDGIERELTDPFNRRGIDGALNMPDYKISHEVVKFLKKKARYRGKDEGPIELKWKVGG